jgi:hypothetical protein
MVNFLGAVVLPSGLKANPVRTTGKTTQQEGSASPTKNAGDSGAVQGVQSFRNLAPADEVIAAELCEKGFDVDSELTAYGRELELLIDCLNRPNLRQRP